MKKRELIVEINGKQYLYAEFRKLLDKKANENGVKYSEEMKMYFNISQSAVYCVSGEKQFVIDLEEL